MKKILIIRHVDYERLGYIPEILSELELPFLSISLALGEDLPALSEVRGVISMGGPMTAYEMEKFAFFSDEMAFMRAVVAAAIPILGICLGGQLLAQAFAAKVQSGERELGWLPLYRTNAYESDPIFGGLELPPLFQFHGDVFAQPEGSVRLIRSDLCENQCLRVSPRAYALQFHPDCNREMVESVFSEYQERLTEQELAMIREDVEQRSMKGKEFLKEVLRRLFA